MRGPAASGNYSAFFEVTMFPLTCGVRFSGLTSIHDDLARPRESSVSVVRSIGRYLDRRHRCKGVTIVPVLGSGLPCTDSSLWSVLTPPPEIQVTAASIGCRRSIKTCGTRDSTGPRCLVSGSMRIYSALISPGQKRSSKDSVGYI